MTTVGIIGAGHVGCALAFELASRGHDVILRSMPGHPGNIPKVHANNNFLECAGVVTGRMPTRLEGGLNRETCIMETVIFITVPSHGHDDILTELALHNLENRIVIFITGNAVAVRANRLLNASAILDTATSPYSSRINADGSVSIRGMKTRLQIASLPANLSKENRDVVSGLFPMPLEWSVSLLEIFLSGVNGVVHVPTALLNLGWIESTNGDFYFYRQGMSSGVCSIIEAADKERLAVAAAYQCHVKSALETYNVNYGAEEKSLRQFAQNTDPHNSTKGVQKRFLDQDVPYWLVLCSELGAQAGVQTPFIDILIMLASTLTRTDYRMAGRSLKSLGLTNASTAAIVREFGGRDGNTVGERVVSKPLLLKLPWVYRGFLS